MFCDSSLKSYVLKYIHSIHFSLSNEVFTLSTILEREQKSLKKKKRKRKIRLLEKNSQLLGGDNKDLVV